MPKLTTKSVETIKPQTARQEIPDSLLRGLYLVVQPSGARSWAVRYRHAGKPCKHTIGSYPAIDLKAARELGAKALRTVAEGRDPTGERRQERATLIRDVANQFITAHSPPRYRAKTHSEAKRLLERHLVAHWGNRPIGSISRADIRGLLNETAADAPVLANRLHGIIGRLFAWARENDIVAMSPGRPEAAGQGDVARPNSR